MKKYAQWLLSGGAAGMVAGLLGAGGGMVLVPLLSRNRQVAREEVFSTSVAIVLPICLVSILITWKAGALSLRDALPFLPGSALGGLLAATLGKKIPVKWLHRLLGLWMLWGGVRYLC